MSGRPLSLCPGDLGAVLSPFCAAACCSSPASWLLPHQGQSSRSWAAPLPALSRADPHPPGSRGAGSGTRAACSTHRVVPEHLGSRPPVCVRAKWITRSLCLRFATLVSRTCEPRLRLWRQWIGDTILSLYNASFFCQGMWLQTVGCQVLALS